LSRPRRRPVGGDEEWVEQIQEWKVHGIYNQAGNRQRQRLVSVRGPAGRPLGRHSWRTEPASPGNVHVVYNAGWSLRRYGSVDRSRPWWLDVDRYRSRPQQARGWEARRL